MAAAPTRSMPRLLKATYLANQEYLLAETRATKLFYFPGPILWILITGALALVSAAARFGWSLSIGAWNSAISTLAGWIHLNASTLELYLLILFAFLVLLGLLFLAIRYLRWVRTVYAVTSRRVIVQRGILAKDFDEIPVTQVRGVDVHQSFGERLLGYGSVRVSSEGGPRLGNEDWKGIPKPFRFQKLIENATVSANAPPSASPSPWTGGPSS